MFLPRICTDLSKWWCNFDDRVWMWRVPGSKPRWRKTSLRFVQESSLPKSFLSKKRSLNSLNIGLKHQLVRTVVQSSVQGPEPCSISKWHRNRFSPVLWGTASCSNCGWARGSPSTVCMPPGIQRQRRVASTKHDPTWNNLKQLSFSHFCCQVIDPSTFAVSRMQAPQYFLLRLVACVALVAQALENGQWIDLKGQWMRQWTSPWCMGRGSRDKRTHTCRRPVGLSAGAAMFACWQLVANAQVACLYTSKKGQRLIRLDPIHCQKRHSWRQIETLSYLVYPFFFCCLFHYVCFTVELWQHGVRCAHAAAACHLIIEQCLPIHGDRLCHQSAPETGRTFVKKCGSLKKCNFWMISYEIK